MVPAPKAEAVWHLKSSRSDILGLQRQDALEADIFAVVLQERKGKERHWLAGWLVGWSAGLKYGKTAKAIVVLCVYTKKIRRKKKEERRRRRRILYKNAIVMYPGAYFPPVCSNNAQSRACGQCFLFVFIPSCSVIPVSPMWGALITEIHFYNQ